VSFSDTCPTAKSIRGLIEKYILEIYESDGVTLKPFSSWPGYYTLPNASRIPAVFVVGKAQVPSTWNIVGIECTISEVPKDGGRIPLRGQVGGIEIWKAQFVNYGNSEGTTFPLDMLTIQRRMKRLFRTVSLEHNDRSEVAFEALTALIRRSIFNPRLP
jgi:hypothetical protein